MENNINWNDFGHTYEEHIAVTRDDLKQRMILGTYDAGKYDGKKKAICSRFLNEEIAYKAIKCLLKRRKVEIDQWMKLQYEMKTSFEITFTDQIGEGYAKNTSWKEPYKFYKLVVVLQADCHYRDFEVVTAYPTPSMSVAKKIKADQAEWIRNKKH